MWLTHIKPTVFKASIFLKKKLIKSVDPLLSLNIPAKWPSCYFQIWFHYINFSCDSGSKHQNITAYLLIIKCAWQLSRQEMQKTCQDFKGVTHTSSKNWPQEENIHRSSHSKIIYSRCQNKSQMLWFKM